MLNEKKYLLNCKVDYSRAVQKAQKLYPEIYDRIDELDYLTTEFLRYLSEVKNGDKNDDALYLESLIDREIPVVGVYEYLAKLYSKNKEHSKAYSVCKKWFNSPYWKIPNMATTSLRLLDRIEKLEIKLGKGNN
jgi:hypothetical protein